MKENITKLGKLINNSNKILLVNHKRMDPDAFGSIGAFYYILKKLGKDVKAINDDLAPENFSFLLANEIIETNINLEKFSPDLIISLDAASFGQLGETYIKNKNIFEKTNFVVIDHHMTNDGFGNLNIIDKKSSSTCELSYEIFIILGYKNLIDSKIATLLTCGILTDTNIYYNKNTSSKTLKIGGELLDLGADFRSGMYNFFKKRTFEKTKLWGEVLKDIKKTENGKIVWTTIKREKFEKTNTTDRETSGLIGEFLACIEGVEVCFILYELEDLSVKGSFRSLDYDVATFAKKFSGGGHKLASGFTSNEKIEVLEKEIVEGLEKEIK